MIQEPMFQEGYRFPSAYRESEEAVLWRLARMMQRGVLIGYEDVPTVDERTMRFIDQFGEHCDRYPKIVSLLLNAESN